VPRRRPVREPLPFGVVDYTGAIRRLLADRQWHWLGWIADTMLIEGDMAPKAALSYFDKKHNREVKRENWSKDAEVSREDRLSRGSRELVRTRLVSWARDGLVERERVGGVVRYRWISIRDPLSIKNYRKGVPRTLGMPTDASSEVPKKRRVVVRVCVNCAAPTTRPRLGRCEPCYAYMRRHGVERALSNQRSA
jgi:hypothetical protein